MEGRRISVAQAHPGRNSEPIFSDKYGCGLMVVAVVSRRSLSHGPQQIVRISS